jgi:uncharacterized protein YhaN
VRLRRLNLQVFGPHRDCLLDLDAEAVLVFGRNESGKSSFRTAIETVLYGFDPATRDAHPLYQWDQGAAGDLHLEADLETDAGSILRVERVLQATGKCRTAAEGEAFAGPRQGNRSLPVLAHLPREIYRSIYSLELEQLEALRKNVQDHVDDLLLPETDALGLRPVSEIREELRADHRELWRPDRRGKPRAAELRQDLAAARRRAHEAASAEEELRGARAERAELEEKIEVLRRRKLLLERARADAPFLRELFELNRAERRLGEAIDLEPLGGLALVDPGALAGEIEQLESALREPAVRLERAEETLDPRSEAVLAAAAEIEAAIAAHPGHEAQQSQAVERRERAEAARRDAERELGALLTGELGVDEMVRARALPLEAIRALQADWASAWEQRAAAPAPGPGRPPAWAVALGAGGLLLVGLAAFSVVGQQFALLGAVIASAGLLAAALARKPPEPEPTPDRPRRLDELLGGLPIAREFLTSPMAVQRLVDALSRLQTGLARAEEDEAGADAAVRATERGEREVSDLCARFSLESGGAPGTRIERLRALLASARERAKQVEGDRAQRQQAELLLESHGPALERKRAHLRKVEDLLAVAEPDAVDAAERFARFQERLESERFVRRRRAELEADPRWSAMRDDPRVVGPEPPANAEWLPEVSERRDRELTELDAALHDTSARIGALRNALGSDDGSHQARAADALLAAEERLHEVEREHDRLALLDFLLERAERDFREAHQPDVLRRASAYLERITQGRYSRVEYRPSAEGGLHVTCAGRAEPVRVAEPISRGTLDQIFLCLRLGLLDHLDEDRERLPLILDDTLVRMDDARRPDVYRLLRGISPRRQVLLMTCHSWIADEAGRELKARRIDLAG